MAGDLDLRSDLPKTLPATLATFSRPLQPGDLRRLALPGPDLLSRSQLIDLMVGAGLLLRRRENGRPSRVERVWTLPDTVGPDMRLLICGLNPSPAAADDGVGFARPGNRFWPAALAAGLVTRDRDPDHALAAHGIGMTDIVKRTTRRADELEAHEYVDGLARLERLVGWLRPPAVCFVGLAGWRVARDRHAVPGWQPTGLAGALVYVMPSTSGLNASSRLADLTAHLAEAGGG